MQASMLGLCPVSLADLEFARCAAVPLASPQPALGGVDEEVLPEQQPPILSTGAPQVAQF